MFTDDMEAGVNGWSPLELSGSNPWQQTTGQANSPVTSWFVADIATVGDSVVVMPMLAALAPGAELRFAHLMNSEAGFDGGVLEYTVDGNTWLDAAALITEGGYNATIDAGQGSPLAGRDAWSGDLGGWQTVRVDVSGLTGSDVGVRWRFATDTSVLDEGWYLDDVVVEATTFACTLIVPGEPSAPAGSAASFRIDADVGGFALSWSEPAIGGPVDDYVLYATPLAGLGSPPSCETGLGNGTMAILPTLPDDHAFVVVARNAMGEGSYGSDSSGNPRPDAVVPCP